MGLNDFFNKGVEKKVEPQVEKPVIPIEDTKISDQFYTIVSGDSLSKIAKHFYGDAMKWKVIFEANKSTIKAPDMIHPGQKITIPKI